MKRIEIIGQKYERLTVIADAPSKLSGGRPVRYVLVECECGSTLEVSINSLRMGRTTSCGCRRKEVTGAMARKHGQAGTPLYKIWKSMRSRCNIKSASGYSSYGERGIKVCPEWDDYEVFYTWAMKNGYVEGLTIERINNDGNYEPSNCRWTTRKKQTNNR